MKNNSPLLQPIEKELLILKQKGLWRTLEKPQGLDFASNDYLGLSHSKRIHSKVIHFLEKNPQLGATGSRLISGHQDWTEETEAFLASEFKAEACLFFGTGYLANLGVLSALGGEETLFFSDTLNHASLIDGIQLSKSSYSLFLHQDLSHLEDLLKKSQKKRKVIVTETLFSMDGDSAKIKNLFELANRWEAFLILDEAHATGTQGERGLGFAETLRSRFRSLPNLISIHTGGKALGSYGAFVCCSQTMKQFLIQRARSLIFTTALPPLLIAHIRFAVLELLQNPQPLLDLKKAMEHSHFLLSKKYFQGRFFEPPSPFAQNRPPLCSPIVPIRIQNDFFSISLSNKLKKKGFFVKAIRFPAVPKNQTRLRITLKAFHKSTQLKALYECIQDHILKEIKK